MQKKAFSPIGLSRKPFGEYELQTLGDEKTYISFVAEKSAYVHQICIDGQDLLLNYATAAELNENLWYRNHALLPFPNRLFEGKYKCNNQPLSFEINDKGSSSALHGFGSFASFKVERFELTERTGKVKLVYLHRPVEHLESYPFLVQFEVELAVDLDSKTITWGMSAMNLGGTSAPVGLGWHPYFALPKGGDWRIQFPPNQKIDLNNSIPTGKRLQGLSSKQPERIEAGWDDCFALLDPQDLEVLLVGKAYSLSLKQVGTTRYTQLYVPGDRGSIAIEPMTCGVNAFVEAEKEVLLEPQGIISTGMKMQVTNKDA